MRRKVPGGQQNRQPEGLAILHHEDLRSIAPVGPWPS